jgi:dTDP-glucose 4,6-dehydratase
MRFYRFNFVRLALQKLADCRIVNLDKLTYAGNPLNLADIERDSRYKFIKAIFVTVRW